MEESKKDDLNEGIVDPIKDLNTEDSNTEKNEEIKITESDVKPETGEEDYGGSSDIKTNLAIIAIVIGVFVLIISGSKLYSNVTGGAVIDIDDMHLKNLEGDLDPEKAYTYNGFSFVEIDGLWWSSVKLNEEKIIKIPLHFGPREVEDIPVNGELDARFNKGPNVFMAIDPYLANKFYTLALSELNANVIQGFNRRIVAACTEENEELCAEREILNCDDAKGKPVIEMRISETPKVTLEGTCILIEGDGYDLVRAANRVIWKWYRVME